jgi:hypothetical protein
MIHAHTTTESFTPLQNRLSLIVYLEDSLRSMTDVTAGVAPSSRLGDLVSTFVEGLDFVLMTFVAALETGDRERIELLVDITGDRDDLMEHIRQSYLAEESSVDSHDRAVLLRVTNVFERTIWMMQRLARLLDRNARTLLETAPVASSTADLASAALQHRLSAGAPMALMDFRPTNSIRYLLQPSAIPTHCLSAHVSARSRVAKRSTRAH